MTLDIDQGKRTECSALTAIGAHVPGACISHWGAAGPSACDVSTGQGCGSEAIAGAPAARTWSGDNAVPHVALRNALAGWDCSGLTSRLLAQCCSDASWALLYRAVGLPEASPAAALLDGAMAGVLGVLMGTELGLVRSTGALVVHVVGGAREAELAEAFAVLGATDGERRVRVHIVDPAAGEVGGYARLVLVDSSVRITTPEQWPVTSSLHETAELSQRGFRGVRGGNRESTGVGAQVNVPGRVGRSGET